MLHLAAAVGFSDVIASLLKLGANPNLLDRNGTGPLTTAITRGKLLRCVVQNRRFDCFGHSVYR